MCQPLHTLAALETGDDDVIGFQRVRRVADLLVISAYVFIDKTIAFVKNT